MPETPGLPADYSPATSLEEIAALCRAYAEARRELSDKVEQVRSARRKATRPHRRGLSARTAGASGARDELRAAIRANPDLFGKPRTRTLEGVKVGYRKQPGKIVADETRAISRIRKLFPDREAELVRVKESLDRAAVRKLDARAMAAIGVSIADVDDEIVIVTASDDLDRLVDAMLDELETEDDAGGES